MRYAYSLQVLSGLLALTFAGCSGSGSSDSTSTLRVRCAGGESFCLINCDLGCSQTGCSITEIAENQRLKFTFSNRLAVNSVSNSSVSIRTATGIAPDGDLLVSGSELTFVPRVRTINGISSFGFQRNETYIITLAGGPSSPFGIGSESGDRLKSEFSCTVVASRGIADEDQQPPRAELTSPINISAAPLIPRVDLRFSELIDTTPLRGSLTPASPIRYTLRRTINTGGVLTCDRDSQGTVLEGIPRLSVEAVGDHFVTVVSFTPNVQLPGESCIEVVVTADVRDLSGRQAIASSFQFFTEAGVSLPRSHVEGFATSAFLDPNLSGGTWGGILGAGARPAQIGGDGRHGTFDPALGSTTTSSEYTWDTTSVTIPASRSLNGTEYPVTDGKFYFTDFRLPAGITMNFTGPVPPQIFVRGRAVVEGTIKLNGVPMTTFNGRGTTAAGVFVDGQVGGLPGAAGGRGGKGGRECQLTGPIIVAGVVQTNGQNGEDVKLLAGHAYAAAAVNTGGRGSGMNPPTGIAAPNVPALSSVYRAFFAPGGAGGGFSLPGAASTVTPILNLQVGPVPASGLQFNLIPLPVVAGYSSLNHFLVGGSGGGGGGTHAFGTFTITGDVYVAGAGGSGGGGAFALRAGNDLTVASSASLQAKGGAGVLIRGNDGVSTSNANWGVTSPGGGGSGGSFLLQSGANLNVLGAIDTSGGDGSRTGQIFVAQYNVASQAGAGSPGFYRLEAAGSTTVSGTKIPTYNPAQHLGALLDTDFYSGSVSLWRSSDLIFPPQWESYVLVVDHDGDPLTPDLTFTDSGAVGTQIANDINGPVVIQFQGAQLSQSSTEPVPGSVGPWRYGIGAGSVPGIGLDSAIGYRFMMTFNRGTFPACVVKSLTVNWRT